MPASFSSTARGVRPGVRVHPLLQLMMDRPDTQIALQAFERCFDLRQLHVSIPQHRRIFRHKVCAQKIMAVTQLGLFQLHLVQLKRESCSRHFLPGLRSS